MEGIVDHSFTIGLIFLTYEGFGGSEWAVTASFEQLEVFFDTGHHNNTYAEITYACANPSPLFMPLTTCPHVGVVVCQCIISVVVPGCVSLFLLVVH